MLSSPNPVIEERRGCVTTWAALFWFMAGALTVITIWYLGA